jgi:hypothetical protein
MTDPREALIDALFRALTPFVGALDSAQGDELITLALAAGARASLCKCYAQWAVLEHSRLRECASDIYDN